jgi:hypothetical protein
LNSVGQITALSSSVAAAVDDSTIPATLSDRGLKTAKFYVLKYTNMPSCLLETAFISNPNEEKLLGDPSFRDKAAEGIAKGICAYLGVDYNSWEAKQRTALAKLAERAGFNSAHTIDEQVTMGMIAVILERLGMI